jgi:Ca2+-binding RTX toxin-like protein
MSTRKSLRLLAVVAMVTTVLVSATVAGAGAPFWCNGVTFDPANPSHVFYGSGTANGTTVDRSAATGPQIFFWNEAGGPSPVLIGSAFDDVICGTSGEDDISGGKGNDLIFGEGGGGDDLFGNGGDDTIFNGGFGGAAPNGPDADPNGSSAYIEGGKGNDLIYTGDSSDYVYGGAGNDVINAKDFGEGVSADLYGNKGDDTLIAGSGFSTFLAGGQGNDTLTLGSGGSQSAFGKTGMDTLTGGAGSDQSLYGGPDNDIMTAGSGTGLVLYGGAGNDTIANLGAAASQHAGGGTGDDAITAKAVGALSFTANGAKGNDVIKGGAGDDDLRGKSGNDVIWGGDGADFIRGGSGSDVMYGNTPAGNGLDTADGDVDDMDASSSPLIPGVFGAPDTPATSNTFYGACLDAADTADASGTGVDTAYNTSSNTGIENVVNGC